MTTYLDAIYVGRYYKVIASEGIFRTGQHCYIYQEEGAYVWATFEHPVIGVIHQIKIPKTKINDTKVFQLS